MKFFQLIRSECFKKFPGIGEKTAERLALSCLNMDEETIKLFITSLENSKTKIKKCEKCGNLSEDTQCDICKNPNRDDNTLCVVEESKNIDQKRYMHPTLFFAVLLMIA